MEEKRVVVTGMGLITPIGSTIEEFWHNLLNGKGGISRIESFAVDNFDSQIAGEIKNFDPTAYNIARKDARHMDRFAQLAMVAAIQAVQNSGIDFEHEDRTEFGVIWGSGIGGMDIFEKECRVLFERGPSRVSPFMIPMLIPDIAPGHISILYGLQGANYATVSACASSAHAIGESFNHIRAGRAIGMICGGSEAPITQMGLAGFCSLKALSTRNNAPEAASRPFDLNRDGFVMGEGAGALILEELGHARARGATIYGEICGVGFSADAYHITQPVPGGEGARRSMWLALRDAGVQPEQVDYINAHGTSTPFNDKTETAAIKALFGAHAKRLKVNSTKSMTGHLLGASGVVESIATLLSLVHGKLHPTINYETPDPECDLDYIPNHAIDYPINTAISNSFGFGGHNVSLLFKKYEE